MKKILFTSVIILACSVGVLLGATTRLFPTHPMPPKGMYLLIGTPYGAVPGYIEKGSFTKELYCKTWMWEEDAEYCEEFNKSVLM